MASVKRQANDFLGGVTKLNIFFNDLVLLPFADIDECATGKHNCNGSTTCRNTKGSFLCVNCTGNG